MVKHGDTVQNAKSWQPKIVVLLLITVRFAKVLIEAAACGKAVITTDHTGCRDAIKPGVTGILVPVRNEPSGKCNTRY